LTVPSKKRKETEKYREVDEFLKRIVQRMTMGRKREDTDWESQTGQNRGI
jgi:hypothetical protein